MRLSSASQLGWKIHEYGLVFGAVLHAKPTRIWTTHSVDAQFILKNSEFRILELKKHRISQHLPPEKQVLAPNTCRQITELGSGGGVAHLPPQSGTRLHFYKQYLDTATDNNKVATRFTVFGQGYFAHTSLRWRGKSLTCDSPASGCRAIPWLHWRGSPPPH